MHRPPARRARLLAGALIALGVAGCADDGPTTLAPTVVSVAAQPCRRPTRDLGLGVVVGDGLVLTAAHIVDGPRRTVTVADLPARGVAVDARTDLALLAAPVHGRGVTTGTPTGAAHVATAAAGSIDVVVMRTGSLVVHDATAGATFEREVHTFRPTVAPGTSGAPLVDDGGQLLGIVVLDNRTDAIAYAVTGAEIDHFLQQRRIADGQSGCLG